MKPIKLTIIGCGLAARNIRRPALEKLKDEFQIVCGCNHTEQKAKDFANLLGDVAYCVGNQPTHKVQPDETTGSGYQH